LSRARGRIFFLFSRVRAVYRSQWLSFLIPLRLGFPMVLRLSPLFLGGSVCCALNDPAFSGRPLFSFIFSPLSQPRFWRHEATRFPGREMFRMFFSFSLVFFFFIFPYPPNPFDVPSFFPKNTCFFLCFPQFLPIFDRGQRVQFCLAGRPLGPLFYLPRTSDGNRKASGFVSGYLSSIRPLASFLNSQFCPAPRCPPSP